MKSRPLTVKEKREAKINLLLNLLQLKRSAVDDTNSRSIMSVSGNKWITSRIPCSLLQG